MFKERPYRPLSGWMPLLVTLAMLVAGPWLMVVGIIGLDRRDPQGGEILAGSILLVILGFISLFGFMAIAPNQARVLLLFGSYKGSVLRSGFFWVNPFFSKKKISLRIRNFETGSVHTPEQKDAQGKVVQARGRTSGKPSKVNDRDGNPIEISAVVVWRVVNTGRLYS